jgi:hypothetical protein
MNVKQKKILRGLVVVNGQKYSELYQGFTENDKFPYHLKHLVTKGYVNKREGKYFISKVGMSFSGLFDYRTFQEYSLLPAVLIFICKYADKYYINNHFEQDPNISRHFFALPSAKPKLGLTLEDASNQGFLSKQGINAQFKYRCTYHYVNKATDGEILFANIFLVYETEIDEQEFNKSDQHKWMTIDQLKAVPSKSLIIQRLLIENVRDAYIQDTVEFNYGFEEADL